MSEIRDKMVQEMMALLAQKGLQGASFSEVLAASGAPRGSLYHHFPGGKDELVLAAVAAAGDVALRFLEGLRGKPAAEVTRGFLGLWRVVLTRSDLHSGCAVVAVTVAAECGPLLAAAAKVFRSWRARLAELMAEGGLPGVRAQALAALVVAGAEGAVALARAERSLEPFDLAAAELVALVKANAG